MIDFGAVRKYIYFPRKIERKDNPYIIHVLDKWGTNWRANVDLKELLERKFVFYEMERCQPYSDELWHECMKWISQRNLLEQKYNDLMKNGGQHEL